MLPLLSYSAYAGQLAGAEALQGNTSSDRIRFKNTAIDFTPDKADDFAVDFNWEVALPNPIGSLARANRTIGLLSILVALFVSPLATKADSIYAIQRDGQMLFYRYAGMAAGTNSWAVEQKVIGTGWQSLERVLGGHNGAIYAIRPDGAMLFYRFVGWADGSNRWAVEQKVIGSGWQGLSHVFAGDNGAIYTIRPNGQMVFYRFTGLADGAATWAVQNKVIGTGWQGFSHVFGGDNGAIYAIRPDGQMVFYRYAGMADGSNRWAVEQKVIGSGWQGFNRVFSGDNGAVYVIQPDGRLMFYRFAGMNDGANKWAVEQKEIGTGWMFTDVIAGSSGSLAQTPQVPSHPATAPAPPPPPPPIARNNPTCGTYARTAVADYKQGIDRPECARKIRADNPGRWTDDFNRHYDWCMTAQQAWRTSENVARDRLLLDCRARSTL